MVNFSMADYGGIIAIAFAFNTAFTALYYMVAHFINAPTQVAMAKDNVVQLIGSAVLICLFFGMEASFSAIGGALVCQGGGGVDCSNINHIKVAYYSLSILESAIIGMYSKLYLFEVIVAIMSSISVTMGVFRVFLFVFSVHISPFIALTMIANVQVIIVEAMGYMWGMATAKMIVIDVIKYAVPAVLVPLGVFFRAIPWLRRTGSTILALCFTLYFVLPMAVIMSNYIIFDLYQPSTTYVNFDNPSPLAQICGDANEIKADELVKELAKIENDASSLANENTGIFTKIWGLFKTVFSLMYSFFSLLAQLFLLLFKGGSITKFLGGHIPYMQTYYYYLILELSVAAQFLVTVVVTTVLEFIIVVTAHRAASASIGGETEIFGLSKIL